MSLIIWTYIFGGATVFGLIVGLFSVWNGRMTRRAMAQVIGSEGEQTRRLIESSGSQNRELLAAIQQTQVRVEETLIRMESLLQRNTAVLERLAAR